MKSRKPEPQVNSKFEENDQPDLNILMRRMVDCPMVFLNEASARSEIRKVVTRALVQDLLLESGGEMAPPTKLKSFVPGDKAGKAELNRLKTIQIAVWFLHDSWFLSRRLHKAVFPILDKGLDDFSKLVQADQILRDPDRREEFIRRIIKELGFRPKGETANQAEDRLQTLDTIERARMIREARAAEERARLIREAAAKKAAEEAASTYGRE